MFRHEQYVTVNTVSAASSVRSHPRPALAAVKLSWAVSSCSSAPGVSTLKSSNCKYYVTQRHCGQQQPSFPGMATKVLLKLNLIYFLTTFKLSQHKSNIHIHGINFKYIFIRVTKYFCRVLLYPRNWSDQAELGQQQQWVGVSLPGPYAGTTHPEAMSSSTHHK